MNLEDERNVDPRLWQQVCCEYREMPGLQLTAAQASRLWNTNVAASQRVLDALVETAFLRRSGTHYMRADCGGIYA
jgi:hypothetical protein